MSIRVIKKLIIHCSDSEWGSVKVIGRWYKNRGWGKVGYHYIIPNGVTKFRGEYSKAFDGIVQIGRAEEEIGAHVKGENANSIGVCLIGKRKFTGRQLLSTLPNLLYRLCKKYGLSPLADIYPHSHFNKYKTCPNFDIDQMLELLMYRYY